MVQVACFHPFFAVCDVESFFCVYHLPSSRLPRLFSRPGPAAKEPEGRWIFFASLWNIAKISCSFRFFPVDQGSCTNITVYRSYVLQHNPFFYWVLRLPRYTKHNRHPCRQFISSAAWNDSSLALCRPWRPSTFVGRFLWEELDDDELDEDRRRREPQNDGSGFCGRFLGSAFTSSCWNTKWGHFGRLWFLADMYPPNHPEMLPPEIGGLQYSISFFILFHSLYI